MTSPVFRTFCHWASSLFFLQWLENLSLGFFTCSRWYFRYGPRIYQEKMKIKPILFSFRQLSNTFYSIDILLTASRRKRSTLIYMYNVGYFRPRFARVLCISTAGRQYNSIMPKLLFLILFSSKSLQVWWILSDDNISNKSITI